MKKGLIHGFAKKMLSLVLILGQVAVFASCGCMKQAETTNKTPTPSGRNDETSQSTPQTTDKTPEQTTTRPEETTIQTTEKIVTLSEKIANFYAVRNSAVGSRNFTMSVKQNGEEQTIKIDPDATMYDDNKIFSFEGNKRYWYNLENNVWVREVTEDEDPSKEWVDWMASFEISTYFEDGDYFRGSDDKNHSVLMYEIPGGFYFSSGDTEVKVTGIGETEIKIPRRWEEREEQIVDVSLVNADGSYKLDLMKGLLWDWIKTDNQFGKDVLAYKLRNDQLETERILFVNPSEGALRFGAVTENQYGTYYNVYSIANVDYSSKATFMDSLKGLSSRSEIGVIYDAVEIDTSVSDEDVATRTANVMNYLGKGNERVVDVCESVRIGSSLVHGNGMWYKTLIVTERDVLLVNISALSKGDVLDNTDKWSASLDSSEIITKQPPLTMIK